MDSSNFNNIFVQNLITHFIIDYLSKNERSTIQKIVSEFDGPKNIKEWEIRYVINYLLRNNYLKKLEDSTKNNIEIALDKPIHNNYTEYDTKIVISLPRMRELGLFSIQERNQYYETKDCFANLISSSINTLRICSPFIEKNILSEDSFPELRDLFLNALDRGVYIKILTREIFLKRSSEINWIIDITKESKNPKNMSIVDYHINQGPTVFSSAHAKMIISDYTSAYIGSAELRRNSLLANFEVGCYLTGPQIAGICELFDLMYSKGKKWY